MSDPVAALRKSDMFSALDDGEIERLSKLLKPTEVVKGELLFAEGSPSDSVYFIESGEVRIGKGEGMPPSRFARFLATLGPGDVFGELSLVLDEPRTAGALVSESGLLFRMSKADFQALLEARDEFSWHLHQALLVQASERLRDALSQAVEDPGEGSVMGDRILSFGWR